MAEMGKHHHELHGHVAFAAWLGVHAAYLISGSRTRIDASIAWASDFIGTSPAKLDHRRSRCGADRLGSRGGRRRAAERRAARLSGGGLRDDVFRAILREEARSASCLGNMNHTRTAPRRTATKPAVYAHFWPSTNDSRAAVTICSEYRG